MYFELYDLCGLSAGTAGMEKGDAGAEEITPPPPPRVCTKVSWGGVPPTFESVKAHP